MAVMECEPAASWAGVVVQVATPPMLVIPVPRVVEPSLKVTMSPGVGTGVTVAVNVTGVP